MGKEVGISIALYLLIFKMFQFPIWVRKSEFRNGNLDLKHSVSIPYMGKEVSLSMACPLYVIGFNSLYG